MLYPNAPLGKGAAPLPSGARRKTACTDYPIQDSLGDGIVDDVYEHPAGDAEGLRLEIHGYSSSRCAQASDRGWDALEGECLQTADIGAGDIAV